VDVKEEREEEGERETTRGGRREIANNRGWYRSVCGRERRKRGGERERDN
jgi:hypothetical protein